MSSGLDEFYHHPRPSAKRVPFWGVVFLGSGSLKGAQRSETFGGEMQAEVSYSWSDGEWQTAGIEGLIDVVAVVWFEAR